MPNPDFIEPEREVCAAVSPGGHRMTKSDARRRAHHAELLLLAAHTLRNYGRPELGDELGHLANLVHTGHLVFAPPWITDQTVDERN